MIKSVILQSGGLWDFEKPFESKFTIEDIAHNTSHICRFNGGCDTFYAVSQHSVGVWQLVRAQLRHEGLDDPEIERIALVHDGQEAFYGDMTTWLKSMCPDYQKLEDEGENAVRDGLKLPRGMPAIVKRADYLMLSVERRHLFKNITLPKGFDGFHHLLDITDEETDQAELLVDITPWSPRYAKARFLEAWYEEIAS